MNNLVDQYILTHKKWQSELELLREILNSSELVEEVKWGAPTYTVAGKNVIGLGAYKSYVGLWFFQGVVLSDKKRLLINAQEGKTKAMRQWRFSSIDDINVKLAKSYISEAIENQKQGKVMRPAKPIGVVLPQELLSLLSKDSSVKSAFNSFSSYKQKEFAEYITEAKRETTKASRLKKVKPMILAGIGLNDKYR